MFWDSGRHEEVVASPTGDPCAGVAMAEFSHDKQHVPDGDERLAQLQAENAELQAENAELQAELIALRAQVQELRRRLGLDSSNSGKPPSSDGPAKPPAEKRTHSQRGRSGKPSGGQRGHPGTTLSQNETPDRIVSHLPSSCGQCGAALSADDIAGEPQRRQVFDLPPPPPLEVTEHQAQACRCAVCGSVTRAAFAEGVSAPVQYGERIAATAVYLQNAHFLPEERLAEVFDDLFGVAVCAATLAGMTRKAAERWRAFTERVRDLLVQAPGVKHLDETGFRIGGRTQWLHVLSTPWLTFYRTSPRRGSVLEGLRGILVHDHWATYFTLERVLHALCNAHHLRELEALAKLDREAWARRMQQLLVRANRAVGIAREQGKAVLPRSLLDRIVGRYDQLVREGLAHHEALPALPSGRRGRKKRRAGHNLALRLRDRRDAVLRFLNDFRVPFTNNQAEQDVRMMKLRMKISGGFRSEQGAKDFATLRSVLSTARKQGLNRLEVLLRGPDALWAKVESQTSH